MTELKNNSKSEIVESTNKTNPSQHKVKSNTVDTIFAYIFLIIFVGGFVAGVINILVDHIVNRYNPAQVINDAFHNLTNKNKAKNTPPVTNKTEEIQNSDGTFQYKNWVVSSVNNETVNNKRFAYHTDGNNMYANSFGWVKYTGECMSDYILLGISTNNKNKAILNELITASIPIKISFPEADSNYYFTYETSMDAIEEYDQRKVAIFYSLKKVESLDKLLEHFHQIKVEISPPFDTLFDVPADTFSLDGFIASKLKAQELCELNSHST